MEFENVFRAARHYAAEQGLGDVGWGDELDALVDVLIEEGVILRVPDREIGRGYSVRMPTATEWYLFNGSADPEVHKTKTAALRSRKLRKSRKLGDGLYEAAGLTIARGDVAAARGLFRQGGH
jgi:hypothetical protein